MRERMAKDPEYREARLAVSRGATKRYRERHPLDEDARQARRARDNASYEERKSELGVKRRSAYVGEKAERVRANNRAWYAAHREERRALTKTRRRANGDAVRAKERELRRRDYAKDPAKYLARNKAWREKNPERAHLYVRISAHKRRLAAAGTSFTREEWLAVVESYAGRCAYCGNAGPLEIEHKIPLSRGGTNSIDNIVPSCKRCNRRKLSKTDSEFRAFLAREAATKAESSESAPGPGGSGPAG